MTEPCAKPLKKGAHKSKSQKLYAFCYRNH